MRKQKDGREKMATSAEHNRDFLTAEQYALTRVQKSPLNAFAINHVSRGTFIGSHNFLVRPELRKPTTEFKTSHNE